MGRELRMVAPNWEHPKNENGNYQPLHDESYTDKFNLWIEGHNLWADKKHPNQLDGSAFDYEFFDQWEGSPPDSMYYRPKWKDDEMTWYQVYETVSEGTPVSPPFETEQELVDYLVLNGDFWDQERRKNKRNEGVFRINCDPWSKEAAEKFVFGSGWAPSMIVSNGELKSGVEGLV